jgi:hypothetical protein
VPRRASEESIARFRATLTEVMRRTVHLSLTSKPRYGDIRGGPGSIWHKVEREVCQERGLSLRYFRDLVLKYVTNAQRGQR